MASFYQPTASNDEDTCEGWQVYCPSLLSSSARLENAYQYVTLIVACVGLGLPFVFSVGRRLQDVLSKMRHKSSRYEDPHFMMPEECFN